MIKTEVVGNDPLITCNMKGCMIYQQCSLYLGYGKELSKMLTRKVVCIDPQIVIFKLQLTRLHDKFWLTLGIEQNGKNQSCWH